MTPKANAGKQMNNTSRQFEKRITPQLKNRRNNKIVKPNEISVVKHADYALTVEIDMWHKGELQYAC